MLLNKRNSLYNKILAVIFFSFLCVALYAQEPDRYRQHAEYEPTEAVWMLYPLITHKLGYSNQKVQLQMIQALAVDNKIKMVVPDDKTAEEFKKSLPKNLLADSIVSILIFPYTEFWARDMGPVFVTNNKGQKAVADFMFNNWGYTDTSDAYSRLNEKLDEKIAAYYQLPVLSTTVVSEGGDREINSKGTLLLVEAVEKQRNPSLTMEQMEISYKRLLGASKIIWFKQGVRDDDHSTHAPIDGPGNKKYYTMLTTGGHVDEFARFVNDSTIVLAWVAPADRTNDIEKQTGERMETNYEILRQATDQDGKPFNIIKMPMPYVVTATLAPGDSVYAALRALQTEAGHDFPDGKKIDCVAAASYLNFLIANDVVLVAKYWHKGLSKKIKNRDEEAKRILQKLFPAKKIIAIDAMAVNLGGGGMHCITMNEPFGTK